jgi:predicted Zn-dependent protease
MFTIWANTFGLGHCDDWRCEMAASHSVERLNVKGMEFCGECRKVVEGSGMVYGG